MFVKGKQRRGDEPLVNGHSTAPPLVVISNNSTQHHAKHLTTSHVSLVASTTTTTLASSPVTIDLSTKGLNHQQNAQYQLPSGGHQQHAPTVHPALGVAGLPTTPPASNLASLSSSSSSSSSSSPSSSSSSSSSSCSSNSSAGSTLTVSPIDDSQSSLNLSNGSSINGYITSANSSTGGGITATITTGGGSASSPLPPALGGVLPVSINGVLQASAAVSTAGSINGSNAIVSSQHPGMLSHLSMDLQQQVAAHSPSAGAGAGAMFANVPTGTRRRTTSSNSNGVGTREVHNKLEKNRRAHLKECFEQLKKQLSLQPDEKKISNLSILHAAIRHIQLLKRKEREFEHEMERLAKEKIAAQNRILLLKREITQMGDIDVSRLAPDTDITPNPSSGGAAGSLNLVTGGVPSERDHLTENTVIGTIMQGRNGVRYSSSSSLSSIATNASITNLPIQTTISPVLSVSSPSRGSPALLRSSTSPPSSSLAPSSLSVSSVTPSSVMLPLSLTTKGSNGLASEAQNGPVGGSSTQPALKFTTAPLNGLNLSNASVVNGSVTGSAVTVNGTNGTTAPLPVIVGANGTTSIVGITHPQLLTTTAAPSIQTLPLNLNVTSSAKSNGLSGNGGPTSIAITTSNGGSSGHLSAHQAIQLTSSTNGTNGGSVNGSSITTTASGTNARSVYNAAIATGTTTIATNTLAGTMVMTAAGLPLLAANGKELINGTIGKNGTVRTESSKLEIIATQSQPTNHTAAVGATAALDPPGTKVITLMNGSHTFALGPLEKDSKMGSVVYSPILVPTPQGLRVIQPGSNGLATIELAPPNGGNRLQLHLTH
uniref:Max-binding protein MNT n=1 Tax=Anopheles atroparvus TaxID=41427 RepID=A0A182J8W5_ANOAO